MSEFVFDVGLSDFEARVIRTSMDTPVFVDFWAPWCGPCKTLGPLLEKLANEYQGRFVVAKVNADEFPQIAQHFGIRGIPTVKILFEGRIVDEFTGAVPENQLRVLIERVVPPPAKSVRDEAAELVAMGDPESALTLLLQSIQEVPDDEGTRLDAIEIMLDLDRVEDAQSLLEREYNKEADRANALRSRVALLANKTDTGLLERKLEHSPDDHALRIELARAHAANSDFRKALESALEVVRRDRTFDDGLGRKVMLEIFSAIGSSERYDDLVREYRRALSALLN